MRKTKLLKLFVNTTYDILMTTLFTVMQDTDFILVTILSYDLFIIL